MSSERTACATCEGGGMKLFEFIWGGEEVTVNYTQEFLTADRVVQLDALVDAKALISDAYESLMEQAK